MSELHFWTNFLALRLNNISWHLSFPPYIEAQLPFFYSFNLGDFWKTLQLNIFLVSLQQAPVLCEYKSLLFANRTFGNFTPACIFLFNFLTLIAGTCKGFSYHFVSSFYVLKGDLCLLCLSPLRSVVDRWVSVSRNTEAVSRMYFTLTTACFVLAFRKQPAVFFLCSV